MDFRKIQDILLGDYIPPCGRNPYYEDPRDVKPEQDRNQFNGHDFNPFMNIPVEINMVQCSKCGTYFQSRGFDMLCENCRKEVGRG